jgi:hypothetical protein
MRVILPDRFRSARHPIQADGGRVDADLDGDHGSSYRPTLVDRSGRSRHYGILVVDGSAGGAGAVGRHPLERGSDRGQIDLGQMAAG